MDRKLDLSAYTSDPRINRYWSDDADHGQQDVDRAYEAFSLGNLIIDDMYKADRPLRYLLQRAAKESGEAVAQFFECDLSCDQGIQDAKALQSRAIRYRELTEWLAEAVALRDDAKELIDEYEREKLLNGVDLPPDLTGDELDGRSRL